MRMRRKRKKKKSKRKKNLKNCWKPSPKRKSNITCPSQRLRDLSLKLRSQRRIRKRRKSVRPRNHLARMRRIKTLRLNLMIQLTNLTTKKNSQIKTKKRNPQRSLRSLRSQNQSTSISSHERPPLRRKNQRLTNQAKSLLNPRSNLSPKKIHIQPNLNIRKKKSTCQRRLKKKKTKRSFYSKRSNSQSLIIMAFINLIMSMAETLTT